VNPLQILVGILLAVLIAGAAHRLGALSRSGAIAATFVGAIILGLGGWPWAVLLLAFFISSSALTRAFRGRKAGLEEKYSKGGRRDAGQVLGNGALPALLAGLHVLFPAAIWPWLGFAAALAAVNADTWATELGALNPGPPRLVTDLRKRVERGTSGGVSPWGTAAALSGAALIGILAALLSPNAQWLLFPLVTASGLLGSLFDSLLGATVQAMYFCPKDQKETEKHPLHTCGTQTVHLRGWKWLDNDRVNLACGAFGAVTAILTGMLYWN
jgi:uncharacterized protein (TIGR00297 family)